MDRTRRLLVVICLVLASTSAWLGYVVASTSPTVNRIGTSGNVGPCTLFVSLDGTTPIAEAMVQTTIGGTTYIPGDNFVGTAGEGIDAFLTSIVANNENICFAAQTFTLKAAVDFEGFSGVTWTGVQGGTIIQQANSVNVALEMIRFGKSTNIVIQDITFDFNRANNPGSPGYTCPNAGWILTIIHNPTSSATSFRTTLQNDEFKNAFCQAIEWQSEDGQISNNQFRGNHEALFLTGILSQRIVVSGNLVDMSTDTTGSNLAAFDLEDRAQNITVSGNVLHGHNVGTGVDMEPANMTTITGNSICCFNIGVQVSGPGAVGAVFNTVTANVITDCGFDGIKVNHANEQGTVITDNTLRNNGSGSTDQNQIFISSSGPDIVIGYNSIVSTLTGNARPQYGIYVLSTAQVVVEGNIIDTVRSQGIRIESSNYATVIGNKVIAATFNGFVVAGTSNFGLYEGNDMAQATGGEIINSQTSNIYKTNQGYNPVGKVTNFINAAFIGVCGTGTTLVSTTVYVVCGTDVVVSCTGGTVTAVTEQDNLGNTVNTEASCSNGITNNPFSIGVWMPVGWKITFTFSAAPTVTVFAN